MLIYNVGLAGQLIILSSLFSLNYQGRNFVQADKGKQYVSHGETEISINNLIIICGRCRFPLQLLFDFNRSPPGFMH